jgi:hypothetical protein
MFHTRGEAVAKDIRPRLSHARPLHLPSDDAREYARAGLRLIEAIHCLRSRFLIKSDDMPETMSATTRYTAAVLIVSGNSATTNSANKNRARVKANATRAASKAS